MVGSGFSHLAGIAGDNCYVVSQRCDGPRHAAVAGWMVTIGLFDPSRLAGGVRPFGCDGRGQLDMTRTHSSQARHPVVGRGRLHRPGSHRPGGAVDELCRAVWLTLMAVPESRVERAQRPPRIDAFRDTRVRVAIQDRGDDGWGQGVEFDQIRQVLGRITHPPELEVDQPRGRGPENVCSDQVSVEQSKRMSGRGGLQRRQRGDDARGEPPVRSGRSEGITRAAASVRRERTNTGWPLGTSASRGSAAVVQPAQRRAKRACLRRTQGVQCACGSVEEFSDDDTALRRDQSWRDVESCGTQQPRGLTGERPQVAAFGDGITCDRDGKPSASQNCPRGLAHPPILACRAATLSRHARTPARRQPARPAAGRDRP